ncbi:MAG: carbohydrate kinase family protein [Candidatus Thorarchaeota archaeon]
MAQEIVAIGRVNIDIAMEVAKLPARNDHIVSDAGFVSMGGSAANFAAQSARLSVKTGIFACVGDDLYGQQAMKELSNAGVDTSCILVLDKQPTGLFFVAQQPDGKRLVVAEPGANRFLEKHLLDEEYVARARTVHVAGGFPMMAARALEIATTNGMVFSFDPGRAASGMDMTSLLRQTDLLFVNQGELKDYFKISPTENALKSFAKTIPGIVVVKKGTEGAAATDGFEYYTSPVFEVKAVDTLGAGDAFAAGFVTAWTRSENIEMALHVGNAVAALTITERGAQNGQPTMDKTSRLLKKHGVSIAPILKTFRKRKRRKKQTK